MRPRRRWMALVMVAASALPGCTRRLDTAYGRARGESVNGTGAVAELFRARGCQVRTALRQTDELSEWADVIVRFAPYPGPPEREEAGWYDAWLDAEPDRRLVYVPRDYDAERDYWSKVLADLPQGTPDALRSRIEKQRGGSGTGTTFVPPKAKEPAEPDEWFAVKETSPARSACKALEGPWAEGVDAAGAAVSAHETPAVDAETVLLRGDGKHPLAIEWSRANHSQVLVVANGSFLLNGALLNPARRPLALRVVDWAAEEPCRVAFLEGRSLQGTGPPNPTIWGILARVASIRWVVIQMLVLGLAGCLARAPRLGRPRSEPASDADRPAAHPEALGALLARLGRADEARAILDAYRRWRYPSGPGRPLAPPNGDAPAAPPEKR